MTNTNKEIPESVIIESKELIACYGKRLSYLGECQGKEVYVFLFPKGSITGFPFVFAYNREDESVTTITGFAAVSVIGSIGDE